MTAAYDRVTSAAWYALPEKPNYESIRAMRCLRLVLPATSVRRYATASPREFAKQARASRSPRVGNFIPAVPFCHLRFSASRPVERRYERVKIPAGTLGATFCEHRWKRGLKQDEAAKQIGVNVATYRSWEVNHSVPTLKYLPSAIAFLGYDWRPAPHSFGESLRFRRTSLGWSLRELARRARVDWTTIRAWERGKQRPTRRLFAAVDGALAISASTP